MPDYLRAPNERHITQMSLEVEAQGYTPGTPPFEAMLRQRKVEACQVMQAVPSCNVCPAYENCELIRQHLRDLRYGVER